MIYFWCDAEVGACDDEDRRKLEALASHGNDTFALRGNDAMSSRGNDEFASHCQTTSLIECDVTEKFKTTDRSSLQVSQQLQPTNNNNNNNQCNGKKWQLCVVNYSGSNQFPRIDFFQSLF